MLGPAILWYVRILICCSTITSKSQLPTKEKINFILIIAIENPGDDVEITQTVEESTIDLYINGFFDTDTNKLAEDQFCTNISQNCNNLVKFYDGSIWNFLPDMDVKFESLFTKCIKMNKDHHFDITTCGQKLAGMVCRLDCCKYLQNINGLLMHEQVGHSGYTYLKNPNFGFFQVPRLYWQ